MASHTKAVDVRETWKPIEGFENYDVSDHGRIRNRTTNRNSKGSEHFGRMSVSLCSNKKKVSRQLHNLVANAFVPNPEHKQYVYHVNFDRTDCRADNLFWISEHERHQLAQQHWNKRAVLDELKALKFTLES
jgi:hypothetical protein